jgi:predicted DNA-binding transcriptional regulator YafY
MSHEAEHIDSLLSILHCLQSGDALSKQGLADAVGLDKDEVTEHLHALTEAGFNVIYDEKRQGFWIPGGTYLPPTEFTLEEVLGLLRLALARKKGAGNSGSRRKPSAATEALRSATIKLFNRLPADVQQLLGDVHEQEELLPHPRQGGLDRTTAFLNMLQQAIVERRQVKVRYDSCNEGKQFRAVLNPYRLVFIKRCWYLVAYSSRHRTPRTFQVSRLLDVRLRDSYFDVPNRFSIAGHFGNAWQVDRDKEHRAEVRVRFSQAVARDVAEVTWHRTQRTAFNPDGSLDFRVSVDGLNEIADWLFGYGTQAEVLEPIELRQLLAERTRQLLHVYDDK